MKQDVLQVVEQLVASWVILHESGLGCAQEVGDIAPDIALALDRLVVKLGRRTGSQCHMIHEDHNTYGACVLHAGHEEPHKDKAGQEWAWETES